MWWTPLAFQLVHVSHTYATVAFVPFFMAYSLLHGVLGFLTRLILPSVVLHCVGDFVILPIQYGIVPNPLGSSVFHHLLIVVLAALASGVVMRRLAGITRDLRQHEAA